MRRTLQIAALAFLAVATSLGVVSTASANPQQSTSDQPKIALTAQSQWVPTRGDFLVGVRITGAPARADVRVSVHEPVENRAALGQIMATNDAGHELFNLNPVAVEDQACQPGGTTQVTVAPVAGGGRQVSVVIRTASSGPTAKTQPPGVYPVQIRLRRCDGTILARLTTYLVRVPDTEASAQRLRAALVLKLHAPLRLDAQGRPTVDPTGTAAERRLVDAVRAHARVPVTLVPTPESLESLRSSRDEDDIRLLEEVVALGRSTNQVLAPTFVRLDATSWTESGLAVELARQRLVGTNTLKTFIPKADNRTWVGGADLTAAALGRLRETGVQQLVVPESALAPLDTAIFPDSPTKPFKVPTDAGIPTPAVQIDSRLQAAFTRTADPVLGATQLLTELALTSFGQRGAPGGVVISPPDDWRPSARFLQVLLDGLGPTNPLVVPATVDQLFAEVPPAGSNGAAAAAAGDRGVDLVRPLTSQGGPPLGTLPADLLGARARVGSYASMVGAGSARVLPFQRRLDLAGSADLSAAERTRLFALINGSLDHQFTRIGAPAHEKVTLTARDAKFPLTLQNSFGFPVQVVVDLESSNRLTFPLGNRIRVRVSGPRARVPLRVRAPVSGDTPLQVTVRSADGNVVLATSSYTVRSTAVSGVGIVLTAGAALFLLIWWIRHWRRSVRARGNAPSVS